MKQFSLEEFKKNPSRKVLTRSGRSVRILCTDAKGDCPIFGLALGDDGSEFPIMCSAIGESEFEEDDLFFDSVRKEGWMNIFKYSNDIQNSCIYDTKEDAEAYTKCGKDSNYIATVKVEWEEEQA